jgi:hypothetical protein
MTVKEYISDKFKKFGIELSDSDLFDISLYSGIQEGDPMSQAIFDKVQIGIAGFIPSILLRATSIKESGFAMYWNINGVKTFYSFLCKQYGLDDVLSDKPEVVFL